MSSEMLIALVINLCGKPSHTNSPERIKKCYEYYTNCAIGLNGCIMQFEDFIDACDFKASKCDADGFCTIKRPTK